MDWMDLPLICLSTWDKLSVNGIDPQQNSVLCHHNSDHGFFVLKKLLKLKLGSELCDT